MEDKKKLNVTEPDAASEPSFAPRNLTFAENAILTAKVLGALGLIGLTVWGVSLWTSQ